MSLNQTLASQWEALPAGARAALEQQWLGVAAGGLPCGAAIVDARGRIISMGRNHCYDPAGPLETRRRYPLQHTRLAHAELNALANVPTNVDHERLTVWSTQHPCAMCATAIAFIGIGSVRFIADDPSDESSPTDILATRTDVDYAALGVPFWWTVSNALFLYNSAVQHGPEAGNLRRNEDRYTALVQLARSLAEGDPLSEAARSGATLIEALEPHLDLIRAAVPGAPS